MLLENSFACKLFMYHNLPRQKRIRDIRDGKRTKRKAGKSLKNLHVNACARFKFIKNTCMESHSHAYFMITYGMALAVNPFAKKATHHS